LTGRSRDAIFPVTPGLENYRGLPSKIYINEFSASNESLVSDEYGEYDDWIEIYNGNDFPIDIGGLFLTDSLGFGSKSRISTTTPDSTTIPAKGFLLLWADNQEEQGILHLDFCLSRSGEEIGLMHYDGNTGIDGFTYEEQAQNCSFSRYPDGGPYWISMNSTPMTSNIKDALGRVYINEYKTAIPGNSAEDSWIELFNCNAYSVNVGGLFLTNNLMDPGMQMIPDNYPDSTTIPPGGHLIFSTNPSDFRGAFQLDFILRSEGGEIGLSRLVEGGFAYLDSVVYTYQGSGVSTGRIRDGLNAWTDFNSPTPGISNTHITSDMQKLEVDLFYVYPNPVTNGLLYLSQIRNVSLFNLWGSCIQRTNHTNHLDLHDLSSGFYILQTDRGETLRILIQ